MGEKINGSVYKMIINMYPSEDTFRMIKSRGRRTYGRGRKSCKLQYEDMKVINTIPLLEMRVEG